MVALSKLTVIAMYISPSLISLESNSILLIDKEVFPITELISTLYNISLNSFNSNLFLQVNHNEQYHNCALKAFHHDEVIANHPFLIQ